MKAIKTIGFVLVMLMIIGAISSLVQSKVNPNYGISDEAVATSYRNGFISSCDKTGEATEVACGCAYDKLLTMYPDFATNKEREHRILTTGYNSTETDAMVSCVK